MIPRGHKREQCRQSLLLVIKIWVAYVHCVWYKGWVSWAMAPNAVTMHVSTSHGQESSIEVFIAQDWLFVCDTGDRCGNRTQRTTVSDVTSTRTFAALGEWVKEGGG